MFPRCRSTVVFASANVVSKIVYVCCAAFGRFKDNIKFVCLAGYYHQLGTLLRHVPLDHNNVIKWWTKRGYNLPSSRTVVPTQHTTYLPYWHGSMDNREVISGRDGQSRNDSVAAFVSLSSICYHNNIILTNLKLYYNPVVKKIWHFPPIRKTDAIMSKKVFALE